MKDKGWCEVRLRGNKWARCKKWSFQNGELLHYELRDGTTGMAEPGDWRIGQGPKHGA